MISVAQPQTPYQQSASLYVGNLHQDVMENKLFDLFNRVGPVASIRVCRDTVTRSSLGYAYVNFHNAADAERTLDTMNFIEINNQPTRIMWSRRDPSLRNSGVGNVFVSNLPTKVDNKGLFDTFSVFGNILSSFVPMHTVKDEVTGQMVSVSKGYGYVHYETSESATDAILKFNGMMIEDAVVQVLPFVNRNHRPKMWTNLYVKNFPLVWDENEIVKLFERFGTLSSVKIVRHLDSGESKGVAFVDFKEHEAAETATRELNRHIMEFDGGETTELYVSRFIKKSERQRDIQKRLDDSKREKISKSQGMNLYVKNLPEGLTDDEFKQAFAKFGTISSARVMRNGEQSKGFGFVCFSSVEEAGRAMDSMHGSLMTSPGQAAATAQGADSPKPIYVRIFQTRIERQQTQAAYFASIGGRGGGGFNHQGGGQAPVQFYMQPNQGYNQQRFSPAFNQQQFRQNRGPSSPQGYPYQQQQQGQNFSGPYSPMQGGGMQRGGRQNFPPVMQGQQRSMGGGMQQQQGQMQGGQRRAFPSMQGQMQQQPTGPYPPQQMHHAQQQPRPAPMAAPAAVRVIDPRAQEAARPRAVAPAPVQDSLADQVARATPQEQKNILGERLYYLIMTHQPDLAGKITGMLLEMDNAELLHLMESPDALQHKIAEALVVLKNHQAEAE